MPLWGRNSADSILWTVSWTNRPNSSRCSALALGLLLVGSMATAADKLWVAEPLTKPKEFTGGIEGPACDAAGNIFAVCFSKDQTIGRVTPEGRGEVWVTLPGKSAGNGIVFDHAGLMYVADYAGHNVLKIDPKR